MVFLWLSHGFSMIIPLKSPFLWFSHGFPMAKPSSIRAMAWHPDLPRCCHFVAVAFTRLHGPKQRGGASVEVLQSLGFMVDTRYIIHIYIYDIYDIWYIILNDIILYYTIYIYIIYHHISSYIIIYHHISIAVTMVGKPTSKCGFVWK